MIRRRISLLGLLPLFSLSFVPILLAEETDATPKAYQQFPEALGVFFGSASGMGLSYHAWLPDVPGSGVQVAAGVLYSPSAEDMIFWGTILDYNVGFEYQRSVFGADFTDWLSGLLYLWAGVAHRGYIEQILINEAVYDDETGDLISDAEFGEGPFRPTVSVGIGIGVEVILFRHFSFPAEVGYVATYDFSAADFRTGFSVTLTPQGGGRYRY